MKKIDILAAENTANEYINQWLEDLKSEREELVAELSSGSEYLGDDNLNVLAQQALAGDPDAAGSHMELSFERDRLQTEIALNETTVEVIKSARDYLQRYDELNIEAFVNRTNEKMKDVFLENYSNQSVTSAITEKWSEVAKLADAVNDIKYIVDRADRLEIKPTVENSDFIEAVIIAGIKHDNEAWEQQASKGYDTQGQPYLGDPLEHPKADAWKEAYYRMSNRGWFKDAEYKWDSMVDEKLEESKSKIRQIVSTSSDGARRDGIETNLRVHTEQLERDIAKLEIAISTIQSAQYLEPYAKIEEEQHHVLSQNKYLAREQAKYSWTAEQTTAKYSHLFTEIADEVKSIIALSVGNASENLSDVKDEIIKKRNRLEAELNGYTPEEIKASGKIHCLSFLTEVSKKNIEHLNEFIAIQEKLAANRSNGMTVDLFVLTDLRNELHDLAARSKVVKDIVGDMIEHNPAQDIRTAKKAIKNYSLEILRDQIEKDGLKGVSRNPLMDMMSRAKIVVGMSPSVQSIASDFTAKKVLTASATAFALAATFGVGISDDAKNKFADFAATSVERVEDFRQNLFNAVSSIDINEINIDNAVLDNFTSMEADNEYALGGDKSNYTEYADEYGATQVGVLVENDTGVVFDAYGDNITDESKEANDRYAERVDRSLKM